MGRIRQFTACPACAIRRRHPQQLGLVDRVVAAQEHHHRHCALAVLRIGGMQPPCSARVLSLVSARPQEVRRPLRSSSCPACVPAQGLPSPSAQGPHRLQPRRRLLDVRRIAATGATGDQVFARVGVHHELVRLRAAHRARVGLDDDVLQVRSGRRSGSTSS